MPEQYKIIRTPDGTTHRFPAEATDDQINEALNPGIKQTSQQEVKPPQPVLSDAGKVGDFLKGKIYDPTIGSIGQGIRDVFTPGSRLKGTHEMISGAEKAAIPLGVAAAIASPEVTLPAMALGALGQTAGTYIPRAMGTSEDVSNVIGDVSGLAAGGLGARLGPNISGAAGGAYRGFMNTPIRHPFMGGWIGEHVGEAIDPSLRLPGFAAGMLGNKFLGAGRGAVEGFKGPVSPMETRLSQVLPRQAEIPPKSLNLSQLQDAVKTGQITFEQFESELLKNYGAADAKIISGNLRSALERQNPPTLGQPEKLASLGTLKDAVISGDRDMNWFKEELKQQGMRADHIELEANKLQRTIDQAKKEGEEGTSGKPERKIEPPKGKPSAGKVEPPKTSEKAPFANPLEEKLIEKPLTPPGEEFPKGYQAFLAEQQGYLRPSQVPSMPSLTPEQMAHFESSLGKLEHGTELESDYPDRLFIDKEMIKNPPRILDSLGREVYRKGDIDRPVEPLDPEYIKFLEGESDTLPGSKNIGEVKPPGYQAFLETEPPYKPPITQEQIEESQAPARAAKETTLARYLIKGDFDLDNIPKTAEYLKAISNEAGLKRVASLRTLENAIARAKELKSRTPSKE